MPNDSSETTSIRIPKKWFGIVPGIVSFILVVGGLVTKGCEMYRGHILEEQSVERRIKSLERWKCAMGSRHDPKEIDWQRVCQPSVRIE